MPEFKTIFSIFSALAVLAACDGVENQSPDAPQQPEITSTGSGGDTSSARSPEGSGDFSALPAPYSEASYSLGRRTFKLCAACHTVTEGGQNLVGPNLHGIFGRKAGSLERFNYSSALKEADFVWTPKHVDEWLANPKSYLPGNNMSFLGVRKPTDRTAVIAYLMLESGYTPPAAPPSEDP